MLFVFVEIGQLIGRLVVSWSANSIALHRPGFRPSWWWSLLLALTIALLNGVVVRFAMSSPEQTFAAVNDEIDPDFPAPMSPLRSGGPESLVSWESLGHQGRVFVVGWADGRRTLEVQRPPGDRADPRLRGTEFRRRHQRDRGRWRPRSFGATAA